MAKRAPDQGVPQYAAGWYPDPQGRFETRYYDGAAWTAQVTRNGIPTVDGPSPSTFRPGLGMGAPPSAAEPRSFSTFARDQNGTGVGLALFVVGIVMVAGSLALPWFGEQTLSRLASVSSNTVANTADAVIVQTTISLLWMAWAAAFTSIRWQPGKIGGFLFAGCLGLLVCWRPLDRDSPSKRSNLLGGIVMMIHTVVLWGGINSVRDLPGLASTDLGIGVWVATAGFACAVVGAFVGRRRSRVVS